MDARPIPLAAGSAIKGVGGFAGLIMRETGGAAAAVRVYDNAAAAAGTLIGVLTCPGNGSATLLLPLPARFEAGIWIAVVSGTVEGCVLVR